MPAPSRKWMSHYLTAGLGDLDLNSIVLPGTHDAGMHFCQQESSLCTNHLVVTQIYPIIGQLDLGARVFDIRPCVRGHQLLCGHVQNFPKLGNRWEGGFGEPISEVVKAVNDFTSRNSELIILNIHDFSCFNCEHTGLEDFSDSEWKQLFAELQKLNHLFKPIDTSKKLTDYKLKEIIGNGPAVIVLMSQWRGEPMLDKPEFGSLHNKGFFKHDQFHAKESNLFFSKEVQWDIAALEGAKKLGSNVLDILLPFTGTIAIKSKKPHQSEAPMIVEEAVERNQTLFWDHKVLLSHVGVNTDSKPQHPVVQVDAIKGIQLADSCLRVTGYLADKRAHAAHPKFETEWTIDENA